MSGRSWSCRKAAVQGRLVRGLLKRERVTPASLVEVATPASAGRLARSGSAATIIDALSAHQVLEDAGGDLIGMPLSMRSERYLALKVAVAGNAGR